MALLVRSAIRRQFATAMASPGETVGDAQVPPGLQLWLSRLKLLHGVPFNYLVPDERMLPPESVRFFYLDKTWIDALIDGAFSIGRNLTTAADAASHALDHAVLPTLQQAAAEGARNVRAQALGTTPAPMSGDVISGFLLRSVVVSAYKNLGVNAYEKGRTPEENSNTPANIEMRPLLRLEALGPQSNTLICLVDGDVHQFDIHEAPEHLHYGIDQPPPVAPDTKAAFKKVRPFTVSGTKVTFDTGIDPLPVDLTLGDCLRSSSPRTLNMAAVAKAIGSKAAKGGGTLDAAEIGFEMTEGVGKVSFRRKVAP